MKNQLKLKLGKGGKPFEKLCFSMCYEIVTEESAEYGENAEYGFLWENSYCTFTELVRYIENDGFIYWSNSDKTGWLHTDSDQDYSTGEYETKSLHAQNGRSLRYLKKAYDYVNPKG